MLLRAGQIFRHRKGDPYQSSLIRLAAEEFPPAAVLGVEGDLEFSRAQQLAVIGIMNLDEQRRLAGRHQVIKCTE